VAVLPRRPGDGFMMIQYSHDMPVFHPSVPAMQALVTGMCLPLDAAAPVQMNQYPYPSGCPAFPNDKHAWAVY